MTRTLTVSDKGLRLIKAFEGYRPEDSLLVTGIRVVGYGHRLEDDESLEVSRSEAEELLLDDLLDYEELVNDEVHAPLSQGQFDALVSLAFNIGKDAFRRSDIVHALNNGRILDAANGFDCWRKATIGDKTYVVDALLRRRTAEKYLFLQTEGALPSPSAMLIPKSDDKVPSGSKNDPLPTLAAIDAAGLSASAVEIKDLDSDAEVEPADDVLILSDLAAPSAQEIASDDIEDQPEADIEDEHIDEDAVVLTVSDEDEDVLELEEETPEAVSPITAAADSLGERLNALLDSDGEPKELSEEADWPTSLISADEDVSANLVASDIVQDDKKERSNLLSFPTPARVMKEEIIEDSIMPEAETVEGDVLVIDNLAADDVMRASRDPEETGEPEGDPVENAMRYLESKKEEDKVRKGGGGLWIPLVIGAGMVGASGFLIGQGATELLNTWGPTAAATGAITGGLMVLFAIYAVMRGRFA